MARGEHKHSLFLLPRFTYHSIVTEHVTKQITLICIVNMAWLWAPLSARSTYDQRVLGRRQYIRCDPAVERRIAEIPDLRLY
jgi:hypothetical protein